MSQKKRLTPQAQNQPAILLKPPLLQQVKVVFFDEGEEAGFKINGEEVLRLHYTDIFRFAQTLRMHGKRAKKRCGDTQRHWSAIGDLTDLNAKGG